MMQKPRVFGQAAMEYLSIVGISLLLLTPIILTSERSIREMDDSSNMMLARESLDKMASAAEVVHSLGPPSTMTVEIQFPKNIVRAVAESGMLLIEVPSGDATSDVVASLDFDVTGTLPVSGGVHKIRIEATYNVVNITAVS